MRAFTEPDLKRIYQAVSLARASGAFAGRHGPLEATAWLHLAIADLERLDDAVVGAARADPGVDADLQRMGRFEKPMHFCQVSERSAEEELDAAYIGVGDPVALAVTVERLAEVSGEDVATRLMSFAVRRTAALNVALDATDRFVAGWWSAARFERVLRDASPLAVAMHSDGKAPVVDDDCSCLDHEPLTTALWRRWQHLRDLVRDESAQDTFPASAAASLYERVLDRADMRAGAVPHVRSTASSLTLTDYKPAGASLLVTAQPDLTIAPVTTIVPVGAPIHLWVRLVGIAADTSVTVSSSHAEPVTVSVKPGEWEALATMRPAREAGVLTMTGHVESLGLLADVPTITVVTELPRCAPEHGGSWEIAAVEATETFDTCKPAVTVKKAAGALKGQAAKLITGAYNSAVVASQQCVKKAGTKVCAKERTDQVQKCVEERDQGYNRCTEERDKGYRKCCDWWPCSMLCKAWVWIKNIVCVAWEWVSNVVCVAWAWIKNIVCVAWKIIGAVVCAVVNIVIGIVKGIVGLIVLVVGIMLSIIGSLIALFCGLFGWKAAPETTGSLKVVAVHMAMLRTGKVLLMGYDEGVFPVDADHPADFTAVADSDRGLCAIWDPATGKAHYTKSLHRNLFCAHQAFLPDGRLLVASGQFPLPGLLKELVPPKLLAPGADADLHVFDPVNDTWQRLPNMAFGRWYPTCVRMPDGRIMVTSGTNGWATSPGLGRGIQNTWEYADGSGPSGGAHGTPFYWFHLYPFMHVLGNGQVFTHAKRTTRLFDATARPGAEWTRVAPAGPLVMDPGNTPTPGDTVWPYSRSGPGPGTSVLLPLQPTRDRDRWVYPKGSVMILGGGGAEGAPEPEIKNEPYNLHANTPATRTVEILDLDATTPAWRAAPSMANGRVMPDVVLLPDASVLVVGGGRYGRSGGLLAHFATVELDGMADKGALDPILEPELFDPATETWRPLCRKPIGRLYHTTAMLLADGRVLVAGHDGALNMEPYDRSRYELELFSPPYLFARDGSLAVRPTIRRAPESVMYGQPLEIAVDAHLKSACLISPSALTHQINSNQRYIGLGIDVQDSDGHVILSGAPNANVVQPGWYLLFVVNDAGTPSVGHWLQVGAG